MKNQYYGDINDYKKYAYLRHIVSGGDFSLGINWYLTQNDGSAHGGRINYLYSPETWKPFDEELFSNLHESLMNKDSRTVANARQDLALGQKVTFFSDYSPDTKPERELWLNRAIDSLEQCNIIYLDPDNGLSVPSVPMGRKNCSKYAFESELMMFAESNASRSLVIYQHFPLKERQLFMDTCSKLVSGLLNAKVVIRIRTSNAFFIAIPSIEQRTCIENLTSDFGVKWDRFIKVSIWEPEGHKE